MRFLTSTVLALALLATACSATAQTTMRIDALPERGDVAEAEDRATDTTADDATTATPGTRPDDEPSTTAVEAENPDPERGGRLGERDKQGSSADANGEASDNPPAGQIDLTLTRPDIDCEEDIFTENIFAIDFTTAHYVVEGDLGSVCMGEVDERLLTAWEILAAITPPGQLSDIGLFGGFVNVDDDDVTLAFVSALDAPGSVFEMQINLEEAEADPDELMLTMAHEFAHVFSLLSSEIDRSVGISDCDTYHNTEGCFRDGSLMATWIAEFWADEIDDVDPFAVPSATEGEVRCSLDPSFLGTYAASNPEEDFAEAFSAFVFRLDVESPALQAKMDWFAQQPGLVEFRDRAIAAELGPLPNFFETCG